SQSVASVSSARCWLFSCMPSATTEPYTLSLHDALPIYLRGELAVGLHEKDPALASGVGGLEHGGKADRLRRSMRLGKRPHGREPDRKSTRLNSSHQIISYAVFCLKKKRREPKRRAAEC